MSSYYRLIKQLRYGSQFAILLAVFVFSLAAYSYFVGTPYFDVFEQWAQQNYWNLVIFLVVLKIIGIIWPPLPGVVPLIGAIPVIGWFPAFLIDTIGYMIGSVIAYYLANHYGTDVIRKLFGQAGVAEVEKFKIRPERELEAIVLMKIFGGGIGEFISYAAGLTKVKLKNFILGSIIASVVVGIPLFYYFNFALSQNNLLFSLVPLGVGILLFYIMRRRYFDWQ